MLPHIPISFICMGLTFFVCSGTHGDGSNIQTNLKFPGDIEFQKAVAEIAMLELFFYVLL